MIPKEIFQQIRRIEITTSRLVTDIFAGQYHSVFKGRGIEFEEVREYQAGDDIRTIDWNVTARTGRTYVKKFVEERELTVMILVDASRSNYFASVNKLKNQLAAEIAAVLALSAIRNNDRVGLIIFTDRIEKFIPARKGLKHVLRVIREVLYFKPEEHGTDLSLALEFLNKVMTKKTVSFIISDFLDKIEEKKLAVANKRHDLIAVVLNDPKETELPNCGLIYLEDAEKAQTVLVDTSNAGLRRQYREKNLERLQRRQQIFRSTGVDYIDISTDSSYADALVKFFSKRRHRNMS